MKKINIIIYIPLYLCIYSIHVYIYNYISIWMNEAIGWLCQLVPTRPTRIHQVSFESAGSPVEVGPSPVPRTSASPVPPQKQSPVFFFFRKEITLLLVCFSFLFTYHGVVTALSGNFV